MTLSTRKWLARSVVVDATDVFGMSKAKLADTAGLVREVFKKASRRDGHNARSGVREIPEIIRLVQGWTGGAPQQRCFRAASPVAAPWRHITMEPFAEPGLRILDGP